MARRSFANVCLAAIAALSACLVPRSPAGTPAMRRAVASTVIAPGVVHRRIVDSTGPFVLNVVTVDLRSRAYEVRHVRARDSLVARERVSAMVARQPGGAASVMAAINADFFNVQTGENENNQVIDGEWWKGLRVSDSPFDMFDTMHAQFGIDAAGRPLLDRFVLMGTALRGAATFPIGAVNFLPRTGPEATALYTPRLGTTPRDTVRTMAEVVLRSIAVRGDTNTYVAASAPARVGGNRIAAGTNVLAAYGTRATTVAAIKTGDTIRVVLRAAGQSGDGPEVTPTMLIGGWPRILRGGQNVARRAPWDEGTLSSNAEARHPRSAVGFSRDSTRLYIVSVDGRQAASVGMTLIELADFMKAEGAWDALNFDGGGSTTMVVQGRVVNTPADPAGERPVGNALIVVRRPAGG
jgi:hypothetical protein